jgi:hypothetical protein
VRVSSWHNRAVGLPIHAVLQIEERDGPALEFATNDANGGLAEPDCIEGQRPLQIVNADGEHRESSFHHLFEPFESGLTDSNIPFGVSPFRKGSMKA